MTMTKRTLLLLIALWLWLGSAGLAVAGSQPYPNNPYLWQKRTEWLVYNNWLPHPLLAYPAVVLLQQTEEERWRVPVPYGFRRPSTYVRLVKPRAEEFARLVEARKLNPYRDLDRWEEEFLRLYYEAVKIDLDQADRLCREDLSRRHCAPPKERRRVRQAILEILKPERWRVLKDGYPIYPSFADVPVFLYLRYKGDACQKWAWMIFDLPIDRGQDFIPGALETFRVTVNGHTRVICLAHGVRTEPSLETSGAWPAFLMGVPIERDQDWPRSINLQPLIDLWDEAFDVPSPPYWQWSYPEEERSF